MSSRPLFIKVAESMVILAPMDQLGCFSASDGVARAASSRLLARNGPPEAVSVTFSTALAGAAESAWKMALCSLSMGSSSVPHRAASSMKKRPAATRHSLLASATRRPCPNAATVGASPATPTMALTTMSVSRAAASKTAPGPPPEAIPVPDSRS